MELGGGSVCASSQLLILSSNKAMGATGKNKDAAPPTFAGASPRSCPNETHEGGRPRCRFTYMRAVAGIICCSDVQLRAKEAKKGGGSGLENTLVCCSNVEYDSDPDDDQEIKGGGNSGQGGFVGDQNVSFCCSRVKKKQRQQK